MGKFDHGQPVTIRAADDFYAFVDGWQGMCAGYSGGCCVVKCLRADGEKTLFVPDEQLEATTA